MQLAIMNFQDPAIYLYNLVESLDSEQIEEWIVENTEFNLDEIHYMASESNIDIVYHDDELADNVTLNTDLPNAELIDIVSCAEVIDNWGRQESYDTKETYGILITPEEWTDDFLFYGCEQCAGKSYTIDELIGKRVKCGPIIFTVTED